MRLSPVFLPTIDLTPDIEAAIKANALPVRTGQWVRNRFGTKGQFLAAENGNMYVSWAGLNDGFEGRTQRFARANWHRKNKHDAVTAVTKAPSSVSMNTLKGWFKKKFKPAA